MKNNISKLAAILLVLGVGFSACEKEYDSPPEKTIPEGNIIKIGEVTDTIISVKKIYWDSVNNSSNYYYTFIDDYSVYATVTMGEETGNLYKEIYIQDEDSSAIRLVLTSASNLIAGDHIRIALNGTSVLEDAGNIVLDSVNPDNNIIKVATENFIDPLEVSLPNVGPEHIDKLIKVTNCEFEWSAAQGTYAREGAGGATEYNLVDCDGNELLVRTSDYCNFASDSIPDGKGSIIGVLGNYNGTLQFYIRDPKEVDMEATSCQDSIYAGVVVLKDFNDGSITSGGWYNYWEGDASQTGQEWSGQYYVKFSDLAVVQNFNINTFTNYATTSWLISPSMDLSSITKPVLNFDNTYRYSGAAMELYVSGNYSGTGDPATNGTWLNITSLATWNTDNSTWDMTNSGDVDLTDYKGSSVYVAFKYTGTNSDGATWQLDNITIKEQ